METQTKSSAKDVIINLGAIVALYTLVFSLLNLLFTVINTAYPKINQYGYGLSSSISWPVATLIIFFPIFILLMWLLEKEYQVEPEKQFGGVHKWLTYITLFLAGLLIAGDLITVLYFFLDGQELTTGFLLKVLSMLIITVSIFTYYISDVRGKLTSRSRMVWRIVSGVIILASIVWGFSVLGSPATQRLYKYDEQKVSDLMNLDSNIRNYYQTKSALPKDLSELSSLNYYSVVNDSQNNAPYEYLTTGSKTYNLCAVFNKSSKEQPAMSYPSFGSSWTHPAGKYCFSETIDTSKSPGFIN